MNQHKRLIRAGGLLLATAACVQPAGAQDDLSGRAVLTPASVQEPAVPAVPYDAAAVVSDGSRQLATGTVARQSVGQPGVNGGCAEDGGSGFSGWMERQRAKWRDRMYGYPEEFQRPPVGMAVHGLLERQRQQAQPARRTLYRYDFKAGSSELNEAGQARLARISQQLRRQPGVVLVEGSGAGPVLDTARRSSVQALLASLNSDVSADAVQTTGAPEFSLDSDSALLIDANRLQQTKSRGGSSGSGGSLSSGGAAAQTGGLVQ